MSLVRVQGVSKSFGAFRALSNVSLTVEAGERRAVIGPNGAGKSTLFSIIAGQKPPSSGDILIDGDRTVGERPDELWRRGLTRTFQRNQLFKALTVRENVELACAARHQGIWAARRARAVIDGEVDDVLTRVDLGELASARVANLAYGAQRQLELGLALAGRPKILLLDEPTAGMSPAETEAMLALMCGLPREVTILIVEHDMDVVFTLADRVTVLNLGEVLADGTVAEIRADDAVSGVYMGRAA